MSDCSTHAFGIPTCKRGRLKKQRIPSLAKLGKLYGEPPWTLTVPYPDALPPEALDFIGFVEVGGVRFAKEGGYGN